jgi:hypothetical protein
MKRLFEGDPSLGKMARLLLSQSEVKEPLRKTGLQVRDACISLNRLIELA